MRTLTLSMAAAMLTLLASPVSAQQQNQPAGIRAIGSALQQDGDLAGGSLTGAGLGLEYGISSRVSLGASAVWYQNAPADVETGSRPYDLLSGSVDVRASLIGDDTDFALVLSPGVFRYSFEQPGAATSVLDAGTELVPFIGLGADLRFHLAGPFYVSFSAIDRLTFEEGNRFGQGVRGGRELGHSIDFRVNVSALFRREEPRATFEDLPITRDGSFRPVEAARVTTEPVRKTMGRSHMHVDDGQMVEVDVGLVDPDEFEGRARPVGASVRAPGGVVPVWDTYRAGSIFFDSGSSHIHDVYEPLIQDVADYMDANPRAHIELRGFTDTAGSVRLNLSLAQKRGNEVKERLVRLHDIAEERVDVVSVGVDTDADAANLARRVELVIRVPEQR